MEVVRTMTKVILLKRLKEFTEAATRELLLPVRPTEENPAPPARPPEVHLMRLPQLRDADRKAPYILHQAVTGKDIQTAGTRLPESSAVVRTVFCVYHEDEEEGALSLLNLMEQLRIALLQRPVLGKQFLLDLKAGLEALAYPDGENPRMAPYYMGEMVSVWKLPPVTRLDVLPYTGGLSAQDPWGNRQNETILLKGEERDAKEEF